MGAVVCCPSLWPRAPGDPFRRGVLGSVSRETVSLASRLRRQLRSRRQCRQGDASSHARQPQTPMRLFAGVVAFIASGDAVTAAISPLATTVAVEPHFAPEVRETRAAGTE